MKGDHGYAYNVQQWLNAFGRENVLVCLYDDLERDPQAYIDSITDFLEAPRITLAKVRMGHQRVHAIGHAPLRPRLARWLWQFQGTMDRERTYRLRRILRYLGIWQYCFKDGAPFPPLEPDLEAKLRVQLTRDLPALEEMLGRDLSVWKRSRTVL